jgi:hypothetical protein
VVGGKTWVQLEEHGFFEFKRAGKQIQGLSNSPRRMPSHIQDKVSQLGFLYLHMIHNIHILKNSQEVRFIIFFCNVAIL